MDLSELFRAALESSEKHEISRARELELLQRYLAVKQRRFGQRLRVEQSHGSSHAGRGEAKIDGTKLFKFNPRETFLQTHLNVLTETALTPNRNTTQPPDEKDSAQWRRRSGWIESFI